MQKQSKIIKLLSYQWQIKAYLFILACALWVFVVTNQIYEIELEVPLVTRKIKPGKIIVSELPPTANIRVSGRGKDLLFLKHIKHPRLELDLHTINYFFDFPVEPEMVTIPPGINATVHAIIEPETLKVILEDEKSVLVPVVPDVSVHLLPGYTQVGLIRTYPESVRVAGPNSLIRKLKHASTQETVFEKVKKSIEASAPVQLTDTKLLHVSPQNVKILIEIDKLAERKIGPVLVGAIRIPHGRNVSFEPSTIKVVLKGPARRLAGLSPDSVDAYINLSKWSSDKRSYSPEFNLPFGIELVKTSPEQVRVRMEVR